jgi:anti-sigma28 factor (negative regulator of flagellin synthesis)
MTIDKQLRQILDDFAEKVSEITSAIENGQLTVKEAVATTTAMTALRKLIEESR